MLEILHRQNYLLAVATGKSHVGLQYAMEATNLTGVFDSTRYVDEMFSEPHPAILFELTYDLSMKVERTVMIDDTTYDLRMTANVGAAGVVVTYGAHPADVLDSLTPLYSVKSVPDLHNWLTRHA